MCKKLHAIVKNFSEVKGLSALSNINTRTKIIAAIAVFSALYAVLRPVPLGPMIGLGQHFSISDFLAPLYGIILGPYIGGFSIIIGTFIGMLGKPPVFMGFDFLPALINTLSIGFLIKRKWNLVCYIKFSFTFSFYHKSFYNTFHRTDSIFLVTSCSLYWCLFLL